MVKSLAGPCDGVKEASRQLARHHHSKATRGESFGDFVKLLFGPRGSTTATSISTSTLASHHLLLFVDHQHLHFAEEDVRV